MVTDYEAGIQSVWVERSVGGLSSGFHVQYCEKWKAAKDVWKVYRRIENLPLIYAAFVLWVCNACCYQKNLVKMSFILYKKAWISNLPPHRSSFWPMINVVNC